MTAFRIISGLAFVGSAVYFLEPTRLPFWQWMVGSFSLFVAADLLRWRK